MRTWLALLAALAMPLVAAPPRPAAKRAVDWTRTFSRTADGNFVQGNPAAKVKLVAYLSLTCPHCAHFEGEAAAPLAEKYIRSGQVSLEMRHAIRDSFDLVATVLARCNGPAGFFAVAPALFATQEQWLGKGAAWAQTDPDLKGLTPAESLTRAARAAGLDAFFRARGLSDKRMAACVADAAEEERLARVARSIWEMPGFPGTPAFTINGTLVPNIGNWSELDRKLGEALG